METKPYTDIEVIDLDLNDETLPETTLRPSAFRSEVRMKPKDELAADWALAAPETVSKCKNHVLSKTGPRINLHHPKRGQIDQLIRCITWHTGERPYKCTECNFRTLLKAHMRKHMLVHRTRVKLDPNLVELRCKDCTYSTRVKRNLCRHVRRHEPMSGLKRLMTCHEESRVKRFRCDLCKSRYLRKDSLLAHLKRRPCNAQRVRVIEEAVIL